MYKKYKIICTKYKREDEKTDEGRTKRKENKNKRFCGGKVTLKFWINQTLFFFFVFFEVNNISLSQLFVSILSLFYFSYFHKTQFPILLIPLEILIFYNSAFFYCMLVHTLGIL